MLSIYVINKGIESKSLPRSSHILLKPSILVPPLPYHKVARRLAYMTGMTRPGSNPSPLTPELDIIRLARKRFSVDLSILNLPYV